MTTSEPELLACRCGATPEILLGNLDVPFVYCRRCGFRFTVAGNTSRSYLAAFWNRRVSNPGKSEGEEARS